MNRKIFSIIGLIVLGILLFGAGVWFGQAQPVNANWQPGWMMGNTNNTPQSGYGMMGGSGMMNNGMVNGQYGNMMNGQYNDMMGNGQYGTGMMGMMTGFSGLSDVEPLTIEEAETAVNNYLSTLNQSNLTLGEIMIFSNHAYAQILDTNTEQGAFEVLVDPTTGNVFPEPGPNMMWNTEYGMMNGQYGNMMNGTGMMNGRYNNMMSNGQYGHMMGKWNTTDDAEISVTANEASGLAQAYLDDVLPGTTADNHADTFPGYYTLHIERDGEVIGMLSVNAYTGDVFLHHWHGDFIEMDDAH